MWFFRKPYGHFGAELAAAGRLMKGGIDSATVDSEIALVELNGLYRYPFSRELYLAGRIGGGVALSHHAFNYDGTAGAEIASADLLVSVGLSVQYCLTRHIFLEAGADWMHVFTNGFTEGGLTPFLSAGVLF
jgi:hypothetical protein